MESVVKKLLIIFTLYTLHFTLYTGVFYAQVPVTLDYSSLLKQKMELEREYRDRVQEILDRIVGTGNAKITGIFVDLKFEKQETRREAAAGKSKEEKGYELGKEEYILPGVPAPRGLTPKEKPSAEETEKAATGESKLVIPSLINRIKVAVAVDEKIPDEKINKIRDIIIDSLAMDFKRGDELKITKVAFSFSAPNVPTIMTKFFSNPYSILLSALATLLLFFLFGPLTKFLRGITEAIREGRGTEVSIQAKTEQTGGGPGGMGGGLMGPGGLLPGMEGETLEMEEKKKKEEEKKKPFSFVGKESLKNLVYLMQEETPETISLILTYLHPEISAEAIASLPAELQMKVALCLAGVKLTSEEDVRHIEADIKKKIDFLVGGIDSFIKILDQVDNKTRKEMLAALEQESPRLAQKARERIFLFEDIPTLSDQAIQFLLREIRIEDLAVALRGTIAPQIMSKILANMSEGGKALLKEEMEFGKPVTPDQIEEEQRRIERTVRKMAEEGKIVIREEAVRTKRGVELEGRLEKLEVRPPEEEMPEQVTKKGKEEEKPDPGKAIEHYNTGLRAYQTGQIELAIQELQKSIFHNPHLWQVYQLLGNCYYSRGMTREAISAYEQALNLNPGNMQLRTWLTREKMKLTRIV